MRDKLIELFFGTALHLSYEYSDEDFWKDAERTADYLIAHGVTLAPDNNVGGKTPLSNGDRIRAMTDDELATWLDHMSERCFCCNTDFPDERAHCPIRPNKALACDKTDIEAWLKQPAKEETK